jgi:hypothetical protein
MTVVFGRLGGSTCPVGPLLLLGEGIERFGQGFGFGPVCRLLDGDA